LVECSQDFKSVAARHKQVKHQNVWMVLLRQDERLLAIAGQPLDLEIWLGGEQGSQRFPQHSMIVSNHNPDFGRRRVCGNHNEFLDAIQSSCVWPSGNESSSSPPAFLARAQTRKAV